MNGVHDMGGMTCFGAVRPEQNQLSFHDDWEMRVYAMVALTVRKRYNWDEFRYSVERIEPSIYLSCSYYERWLTAFERWMTEDKVIDAQRLRDETNGAAIKPGLTTSEACDDAAVIIELAKSGLSKDRSPLANGTEVVMRNINPLGHTRLPQYVRGKRGTIDRFLSVQTLPDTNAHRLGEFKQNVYSVRFEARELWGERASANHSVYVDLWECYFEPGSIKTVTERT